MNSKTELDDLKAQQKNTQVELGAKEEELNQFISKLHELEEDKSQQEQVLRKTIDDLENLNRESEKTINTQRGKLNILTNIAENNRELQDKLNKETEKLEALEKEYRL